MAIRPDINLGAQQADLTTVFPLFQQARQAQQQNQIFPLQMQRAQRANEQDALQSQQARQEQLTRSVVRGAAMVKPYIDTGNLDGAMQALEQRRANLRAAGIDTSNTDQAIELLQTDPEQFKNSVNALVDFGAQTGILGAGTSAAQREYQQLTKGLSPEDAERVRRIKLGLDPRAVGSAGITAATTEGLTEKVAGAESQIAEAKAGASEKGKLSTQLKLKPEVELAVRNAINQATAAGKIAEEQRSNARAYDVYTTAMTGLTNALAGTDTGPFVGWSPALTSNQQIADGAVAAIAPVLKTLFRVSGEGTFTDKDQELLLKMVPTRKDTSDARTSKLQNIDAIVQAKLGVVSAGAAPASVPVPAAAPQTFTTQSGITFEVR